MISPQASGLGNYIGIDEPTSPEAPPPIGGGGKGGLGGGGSAMDGVGMVDAGSDTVKSAISTASSALGGGGGGGGDFPKYYKKGGKVVTTRMKSIGKRSTKHPNW